MLTLCYNIGTFIAGGGGMALEIFRDGQFFKKRIFEYKYAHSILTPSDLVGLDDAYLDKFKAIADRMSLKYRNTLLFTTLGVKNVIKLYNFSKDDYMMIDQLLKPFVAKSSYLIYSDDALIKLREICEQDVSRAREYIFKETRKIILDRKQENIELLWLQSRWPKEFLEENSDIFLRDKNVSKKLVQKYYRRRLTILDYCDNLEVFKDKRIVPFFGDNNGIIFQLVQRFGEEKTEEFIKEHSELVRKCSLNLGAFTEVGFRCEKGIEEYFRAALKFELVDQFFGYYRSLKAPGFTWTKDLGFKFVHKFKTTNDLLSYDADTVVLDLIQQYAVNFFGIDNIKRLQEETKLFSGSQGMNVLNLLADSIYHMQLNNFPLFSKISDIYYNNMTYEAFEEMIAYIIGYLRMDGTFEDSNVIYAYISDKYKKRRPYLFANGSMPEELRRAINFNEITVKYILEHKEFLEYLMDRNLGEIISPFVEVMHDDKNGTEMSSFNFFKDYCTRFGNEALLELIFKYGMAFEERRVLDSFGTNFSKCSKEEIDKAVRKNIAEEIRGGFFDYSMLASDQAFRREYPEFFINLDKIKCSEEEKAIVYRLIYSREISFADVRKYPYLVEILKDKPLDIIFIKEFGKKPKGEFKNMVNNKTLVLRKIGNYNFLKLCEEFGCYMSDFAANIISAYELDNSLLSEELIKKPYYSFFRDVIFKCCLNGKIFYSGEDAPQFLKRSHPELFLDSSAPDELKNVFYGKECTMDLADLVRHPEWRGYLVDKSLRAALMKGPDRSDALFDYLGRFNTSEEMFDFTIKNMPVVRQMIKLHRVPEMIKWYELVGINIPDSVVMCNVDAGSSEEVKKFLDGRNNWRMFMKINRFTGDYESKDALLKLAYCFGVFDEDKAGTGKLLNLITGIPRVIDKDTYHELLAALKKEGKSSMIKAGYKRLLEEGFIDDIEKNEINKIYIPNKDGRYTLNFNPQNYPVVAYYLREVFEENCPSSYVFTPSLVHKLFSGCSMEYSPDFRDFFLENYREILEDFDNRGYISNIQRRFDDIKRDNSNRKLTWDLAVSYVQTNKYEAEDGNEYVARVSGIAGYDEKYFECLERIYDYGKQRTFSSIPKVQGTWNDFKYEMLDLVDPLCMCVGTLTNCCQEINDLAESCMIHSMIDENGRVFVIRDSEGRIVSQSWVWRNGNTLCFDNIEVPDRAFKKHENELTDNIYDIYMVAAEEAIDVEEKMYAEKFQAGEISEEEFRKMRLGKVTVGLGYNDIAETIKKRAKEDYTNTRPLAFDSPLGEEYDKYLYTSDSAVQYSLVERKDFKSYNAYPKTLYTDTYSVYAEDDLDSVDIKHLKALRDTNESDVFLNIDEVYSSRDIFEYIAEKYKVLPSNMKILMNPNLAVIYEESDDKIEVLDIYYCSHTGEEDEIDITEAVTLQLGVAIRQISLEKNVAVRELGDRKKALYDKAINMAEKDEKVLKK